MLCTSGFVDDVMFSPLWCIMRIRHLREDVGVGVVECQLNAADATQDTEPSGTERRYATETCRNGGRRRPSLVERQTGLEEERRPAGPVSRPADAAAPVRADVSTLCPPR